MISQDRLEHILAVARNAQAIALKLMPNDEKYAQDMFVLGLLHDLGYEFLENGEGHAALGGEILKRVGYKYANEVAKHGYCEDPQMSDELFILNLADMTADCRGNKCTINERLLDIQNRYGEGTQAHQKACVMAERLKNDERYLEL